MRKVWVVDFAGDLVMIQDDDFDVRDFFVEQVEVAAAEIGQDDKFGFVGYDFVDDFVVYPLGDSDAESCV